MNLIQTTVVPQTASNTLPGNTNPTNHSTSSAPLGTSNSNSPAFIPTDGQIVSGEVIDLRRNEVTIRLSSNETITAPLSKSADLKIGVQASFQVAMDNNNLITLELIPNSIPSALNSTVMEALEAAGLPKNSKNKEIILELLKHQMSIDKQSILNHFRQSLIHKDASISTLVLMTKHNIPMNESTVKQFEHYINYEHRIVKEVETLSNSIPDKLESLSNLGSPKEINILHNELLKILLSGEVNNGKNPMIPPLVQSPNDKSALLHLLNNYPITDQFKSHVANDTANLLEVITVLHQSEQLAIQLDEAKLTELMLQEEVDPSQQSFAQDAFKSPHLISIFEQYLDYQHEQGQIGASLNVLERSTLLSDLKELPLSTEVKQSIQAGTITTNELFSIIKSYLPLNNDMVSKNMLSSNIYKSIIKEHLLSSWTLSPKSLQQDGAVSNLYEKMYKQLLELENLTTPIKTSQELTQSMNRMNKSTSDISELRQNIDFMKTLNEIYTYVQLPLRFKDKTIHSDLYVYTNKKDLKKDKGQISVLLHLDMDNLGTTDIHVNMNYNQITSRFYLDSDETVSLVSEHIDALEMVLNKKGYLFQSEIVKKEKEVDIVEDFIEKESRGNSLQKYSFDIRA